MQILLVVSFQPFQSLDSPYFLDIVSYFDIHVLHVLNKFLLLLLDLSQFLFEAISFFLLYLEQLGQSLVVITLLGQLFP